VESARCVISKNSIKLLHADVNESSGCMFILIYLPSSRNAIIFQGAFMLKKLRQQTTRRSLFLPLTRQLNVVGSLHLCFSSRCYRVVQGISLVYVTFKTPHYYMDSLPLGRVVAALSCCCCCCCWSGWLKFSCLHLSELADLCFAVPIANSVQLSI
jgi:hypothetical protein